MTKYITIPFQGKKFFLFSLLLTISLEYSTAYIYIVNSL